MIVSTALIVASPGIAQASPVFDGSQARPLTSEEQTNLEALVQATTNENVSVPVFDAERARSLGASGEAIDEYEATFTSLGGSLTTDSQGSLARNDAVNSIAAAAAACRGVNGFRGYHWFGPQNALDECNTGALINGIGLAAAGGGTYTAASALTAAGLPAAAVVGVISGILGVGVVFLNICRDASGVKAIYLNGGIPGVVPPSCWGQ